MTPVIVLVLAKAPQPGRVKTRLCPPATPRQAARVAAAALLDTLDAAAAMPGARPVVALAGDVDAGESASELGRPFHHIPVIGQRGSSLGDRIAAAHADTAQLYPGYPVLQIGMDTPQVSAHLLQGCRDRLLEPGTDAVLGLAEDGGWWLLGLRDPRHAAAIAAVPTSRPDTGARTRLALAEHGLRIAAAPGLADVDTMPVARAVASTVPGSRFAAAVELIR
ncbi:DUF2064 domain-containing protein [Amycolatopsis sp. CA-128772]|uniref:TIGR04282 family arsenosugar biosynthesis glycosyltransferase n=1 Tax=Amycolatopsis sp. CA-128772 TaxID=2073159 RepID=UPI000CD04E8D|nr:DUF2064 domain-containing protein [Amycolatopsis sp. CA-128772]